MKNMRRGRLVRYHFHDEFLDPEKAAIAANTSNVYKVTQYSDGIIFGECVSIQNVDDDELVVRLVNIRDVAYVNKPKT